MFEFSDNYCFQMNVETKDIIRYNHILLFIAYVAREGPNVTKSLFIIYSLLPQTKNVLESGVPHPRSIQGHFEIKTVIIY